MIAVSTVRKSIKPYKDFPLSPHKRGWCKKINGQVKVICGHIPWKEALDIYHRKFAGLPTKVDPAPVAVNVAPR